ncbi:MULTISPECIES: branched-chain amino acid ABC transporter permease [unclassified Aeromicrobium]|uniref:branched-chain amino acid ABC transporter permease n=1 Tax=unclassified Aeromicrobium TaxID=2633570 RepID=UPI00288A3CBE|nr:MULTISPECIES: branched-chain amino acid ABC transporter permease [unclassified Aeromicrobium]
MRLTSKVLVSAILACLVVLVPLGGASATDAPSPSTSPSAPTAAATPPDGPYVGVTLQNSGADAGPIAGATLTASTSDGTEVGEAVTGPEGRAFIPIPERGTYVVTLDVDSLPAGIEFAGSPDRTVNALLDGGNFVQFQIGVVEKTGPPLGERFAAAMVNGVKFGLIIALAALGLSLIFGTTKLTNFSHGELITFGAIATYVANRAFGLPVILAIIAAVVASAVFGWLQDKFLWKPLRSKGVGIIAMMIVSIGFGLFLRNIFQYTFGGSRRSLSQYVNQSRETYGPFSLADKELAIIGVAVVVLTVTCVVLMKTRLGKSMRAVADNPALSASSGLRVDGVIRSVWVLGTALTGLAGGLLAVNSQVNFLMGFKLLLLVFAAVTLGGLGTIWGALVGSMIIGIMVEVGTLEIGWWPGVPSSIKEVGALVVLILILLIRPQGILGRAERIG